MSQSKVPYEMGDEVQDKVVTNGNGVNHNDSTAAEIECFVEIRRTAFTQSHLDKVHQRHPHHRNVCHEISSTCHAYKKTCTPWVLFTTLLGIFPVVDQLRNYDRKWLLGDMLSGFVVAVVHIPQSMGFALLTSVRPVYGLYSSFWHVLIYFLFGASPHVSVGTMALISLMIGDVVNSETEKYTEEQSLLNVTLSADDIDIYKINIAASVSLLVGCIQVAMAILQLGIVTSLMSTSLIVGISMGAAVQITASQLTSLLGVTIPRVSGIGRVPTIVYHICKNLGHANVATIVISVSCIAMLIIMKEIINERYKDRMVIQIPAELIILVASTLISYLCSLSHHFDINIVGSLSLGFPEPHVPDMSNASTYVSDSFTIAVVSFVITFSMADTFARKHKYEVSNNQEMFAQGMCNALPAFMWSFAGAAAPPRCVLLSTQGGRTQLSSISTCAVLLLVILLLGPYFKHFPNAALSAIILVALFPMFKQLPQAKVYWRINKPDFIIWLVTFLGVVFVSIDIGLYMGIATSLIILVANDCFIRGMMMQYTNSTDLFRDSCSYNKLQTKNNVKVFKFESDLYFAVKQIFKNQLFKVVGKPCDLKCIASGRTYTENDSNRCKVILIDCSCISYIDIVGIDLLKQLHLEYKDASVIFALICCPQMMLDKLYLADALANDTSDAGIPCYPTSQDATVLLKNDTLEHGIATTEA